jgi:hypothetical protein
MTDPSALSLLVRFAQTGGWGPLAMNAPLSDIRQAWGPASVDQRIRKRHAWPRLLSYGDIEVCVCTCRTVSLVCVQTWREAIDLPEPDHGRLLSFPGHLTYGTVTAELAAADCPWTGNPKLTLPGQRALLAGPFGTSFVFEIFDDGTEVLNIVSLYQPLHRCHPSASSSGAGGGLMEPG